MNINDNSIYHEETIREKARLDEIERRSLIESEKEKAEKNKNLIKYTIVAIGFLIFLYITIYIPLKNMFKWWKWIKYFNFNISLFNVIRIFM